MLARRDDAEPAPLGGALAEAAGVAAPFVAGGIGMMAATLLGLRQLVRVDEVVVTDAPHGRVGQAGPGPP